jgi:hypothetical protein
LSQNKFQAKYPKASYSTNKVVTFYSIGNPSDHSIYLPGNCREEKNLVGQLRFLRKRWLEMDDSINKKKFKKSATKSHHMKLE